MKHLLREVRVWIDVTCEKNRCFLHHLLLVKLRYDNMINNQPSFSSYKEQMKGGDETGRWKETGTWKGLYTHTHKETCPGHTECARTHTCPVTWTLSSLNKLQSPDVTCRHSQKLNTAHTHTWSLLSFSVSVLMASRCHSACFQSQARRMFHWPRETQKQLY